MQLYVVLTILVMTLSTASGLRCFTCVTTNPESCTRITTCLVFYNRCYSLEVNGLITKGCKNSLRCSFPDSCCEGDLCNSPEPTTTLTPTPTLITTTTITASGLRCFTCVTTDPESCTLISTCPAFFNRCFSLEVSGLVTKGCIHSALCVNPMDCCEGDLCNSAIPTHTPTLIPTTTTTTTTTASRLRCFTCVTTNPESCTRISTCSAFYNRCYSKEVNGLITKGCKNSAFCVNSMNCCEGDLCNSAIPTPAASGLRCFTCATIISEFCTRISTCPAIADSCFSLEVRSFFSKKIVKGCQVKELCVKSMDCCEGDLCNSAIPTVPSVILPLVFSAIVTLFL